MDASLSQLFPMHQIGSDGFAWWIGQIESPTHSKDGKENKDPKRSGRFKVRIVGHHPRSCDVVASSDLPWAITMMPVTAPHSPGATRSATAQLEPGDWVVGFFLDREQQQPIIMGSIGQVANSGTVPGADPNPGSGCKSFTTFLRDDRQQIDQDPSPPVPYGPTEAGFPLDGDGTTGTSPAGEELEPVTNGVPNLSLAKYADASETNRAGINWTVEVADNCGKDSDLKSTFTRLLGEMLRDTQQSGGKLGSYVVGQWTGQISDYVGIARKYINKAILLLRTFIAKVKGFVIDKLRAAIDDIIRAILRPNEDGNSLTPVTKWFNEQLKSLGCEMADLGLRLEAFLEDLLFGYVFDIYKAAACQVDKLVSGILNKIQALIEELLASILGPIQEILGAVASVINIIGDAINYVLKLLGIQCNGPKNNCNNKVTSVTTKCKTNKRKDFLDELLDSLDQPWYGAGADWATYTCEEAYTALDLEDTEVDFVGGSQTPTNGNKIISYSINDLQVTSGQIAKFVVTREGNLDISSSVLFECIEGTAKDVTDYISQSGTLGFSPGESSKEIEIQTLINTAGESQEDFFVVFNPETPGFIKSTATKNVGRCIISSSTSTTPGGTGPDPGGEPNIPIINPFDPNVIPPDLPNFVTDNNSQTAVPTDDADTPTYQVTPDRNTVEEGGFITYLITTTNVAGGTILQYTLFGDNISNTDIVGGNLRGQFSIEDNKAYVVVGIENDSVIESGETLVFSIDGTGASASVLIMSQIDNNFTPEELIKQLDKSANPTSDTSYIPPKIPVAGTPITTPNGEILEIPVNNPGDSYDEAPAVIISGQGNGANAIALLDKNNKVTEIRVTNPGFGYKVNLPETTGKRCIIDSFTMLTPGVGYTSAPTVYIDGDNTIADAIIDTQGFVVSVRIKNREKTFTGYPEVRIIGGGGYGARFIPSFVCLDTEALVKVGSAKIGTGSYIDCP
jgi:type III secretion system FlhB-like substrate exporter